MAPRLSILIPTYNEARLVGRVLDEVLEASGPLDAEIVLVDDGSTDGTADIVEERGRRDGRLRVVRHLLNLGKAAAIRSALAHATGALVLVQDADLEYSPADYDALLAPFADPTVQAVYGSRFLRRAWPENMRVPNWIANKVFA